MSVDHYENFPVASIAMPGRLRRPVAVVYKALRFMDDIADEGDLPAETRQRMLADCRAELDRIAQGVRPTKPPFDALFDVIRDHGLPVDLFWDMISAFQQDTVKNRYDTLPDLLDYCRRSANPVGRMMLTLFGCRDPIAQAESDHLCTALQLINFWQDVGLDYRDKNRCYIPKDLLDRHGFSPADIATDARADDWATMTRALVDDAKARFLAGSALPHRLSGRVGFELKGIVCGGWRIAEKIESLGFDARARRPKLGRLDWIVVVARSLAYRHTIRRFQQKTR